MKPSGSRPELRRPGIRGGRWRYIDRRGTRRWTPSTAESAVVPTRFASVPPRGTQLPSFISLLSFGIGEALTSALACFRPGTGPTGRLGCHRSPGPAAPLGEGRPSTGSFLSGRRTMRRGIRSARAHTLDRHRQPMSRAWAGPPVDVDRAARSDAPSACIRGRSRRDMSVSNRVVEVDDSAIWRPTSSTTSTGTDAEARAAPPTPRRRGSGPPCPRLRLLRRPTGRLVTARPISASTRRLEVVPLVERSGQVRW